MPAQAAHKEMEAYVDLFSKVSDMLLSIENQCADFTQLVAHPLRLYRCPIRASKSVLIGTKMQIFQWVK